MNRTHFPFHAKRKELIKIKIIIIIILSFFDFDKSNLECTKILNSHNVLCHSPVPQTVEIIPCFSKDSFHTVSIQLAHLKRKHHPGRKVSGTVAQIHILD